MLTQIGSFRESKSDDRRFYISTATKTLHLRTNSKSDRGAWIQALASNRSISPQTSLNYNLSPVPSDLSVSTDRLKKRLIEEGISETLVNDCEQIMLSEFSEIQGQLQVLCEERYNLLDTIRQLEVMLPFESVSTLLVSCDWRAAIIFVGIVFISTIIISGLLLFGAS